MPLGPRHYARIATRRPWKNLTDYFHARKVFRHPWQVIAARRCKGNSQPVVLELLDGRLLTVRPGTSDVSAVWTVLIKDDYRTRFVPASGLGCVVDVGANIGAFSFHMASRAARLLAFEPILQNHELLQKNLANAGCRQVEVFQAAVSGQAGSLKMFLSPRSPARHSAFASPDGAAGAVEVAAVRLPDVLEARHIECVDFLKLDCEGAEYPIITSLVERGLERVQRIAMEYHPVNGASSEADAVATLECHLRDAGFRIERVPAKRPGQGMLYAERGESAFVRE